MWTHPGKKLLFMGGEFAQEREWNHDHSLDWHLLDDPGHRGMQSLVRDLNRLYRERAGAARARLRGRRASSGSTATDADDSVLAYPAQRRRRAIRRVLVVCNFTPVVRSDYRVGVPRAGRWIERLNTDAGALRRLERRQRRRASPPSRSPGTGARQSLVADAAAARHRRFRACRIGSRSAAWRSFASNGACRYPLGRDLGRRTA